LNAYGRRSGRLANHADARPAGTPAELKNVYDPGPDARIGKVLSAGINPAQAVYQSSSTLWLILSSNVPLRWAADGFHRRGGVIHPENSCRRDSGIDKTFTTAREEILNYASLSINLVDHKNV
jgi:hypothetical protein